MDASLLALGITLLAAALVPLTAGRFGRGAALTYLGIAAWGAGVAWPLGLVFAAATLAATLVYATGLAVRLGRSLLGTAGAGARHP